MHFDKAVGDASRFSPYQNEFKYPTAIEVACFSTCFTQGLEMEWHQNTHHICFHSVRFSAAVRDAVICRQGNCGNSGSCNYLSYWLYGFLGYIYFNLCLSLFPSSCIFLCFRSAKFFHRISIASLWYLVRWRSMMNVFWSWKIVKGLVKTLSKARHSQWPYPSPLACAKMMNMYTC